MRNLLYLLVLAFCWGPSFFFIKLALEQASPITIGFCRCLVGLLILFPLMKKQGLKLPREKRVWGKFFIGCCFSNAIPFCLIPFGEKHISSSLAAILNSCTPLFALVLAHFMLSDEKLTLRSSVGVLCGMIGIITVFLPNLKLGGGSAFLGMGAVIASAFCYGFGMVYSKKHLATGNYVAPTLLLITATLTLLPLSAFSNSGSILPVISGLPLVGVLGLGIFGSGLATIFYFKLIESAGATYLSMSAFLFPLVAIALGRFLLNETLSISTLVGALCVLGGVLITNPMWNRSIDTEEIQTD